MGAGLKGGPLVLGSPLLRTEEPPFDGVTGLTGKVRGPTIQVQSHMTPLWTVS